MEPLYRNCPRYYHDIRVYFAMAACLRIHSSRLVVYDRYCDSLPFSHRFPCCFHHIIVAEDEQKQDLVESSQARSVGSRKGSAGEGNLRQSSKLAIPVEESIGDVTIGLVRIVLLTICLKHLCRKPMTSL